jgi:tetratricopeptide (TPR) repeat protein
MISFQVRFACVLTLGLAVASAAWAADVEDPYFGEALFHAHQDQYFEALQRLDSEIAQHYGVDERDLDAFYAHIDHAEFSVGDLELRYRMHQRAGRAIRAVFEGDVEERVRNDAAYRLARIYFQKDQPREALRVLGQISGEVPEEITADIEFLRANVLMALHRSADAVPVLRELVGEKDLTGFSEYNLGIALYQDGQTKEAIQQLDRAGRVRASDQPSLAIRDKANLVLGTLMFEASEFSHAQSSLDRVRLSGPFSNQALLRAGWSDASAENFERALVPWEILAERESTDAAVQEAILALPYAYSKLEVHGRAAVLYERAVRFFGDELGRVDASIESIRDGEFLTALVREEIRQDKDWVIHLRSLPEAPETFYLIELMASHDFQSALQNYLDLEDMRRKLLTWQISLGAFDDLIDLRRRYYEPILPTNDEQFRKLDAQMRLRLEQKKSIERRLEDMLTSPAPELLATSDETRARMTLEALSERLEAASGPGRDRVHDRLRRLRGLLAFDLEIKYHERLTEAHDHLRALNADVELLEAQYESFVRTRQAAVHSYVGYEAPIEDLSARVGRALDHLANLMERQGKMLEGVATAELIVRRERLEAYQNQARFAFADSYDRAAKAQAYQDVE